jgi:multiple sugar transport system substrate-binding protein
LEANQAFTNGQVAMSMNFFAFFPALANEATNKYAKVTGYFAMPAGPTGKRFAALGGQGLSIVSYSKKRDQCLKFCEWFIREDVQKKWGELGGYTCDAKILASDEFRKATPYNEAFYESMQMVKDFWTIPEYADMLSTANKHWHPYIVANKGGSAQDVQNALMKDWEAILKKANLLK